VTHRAKRFYLCNLIPLWEIDEPDMDVDWPVHHACFGDFVEMRADIKKRKINWSSDGQTPSPDLKIRFEVYESDFLLTGGLDDHMGTFSSHSDYGSDSVVRPVKIVTDVDNIPLADREQFIFIHWSDPFERTTQSASGETTTEKFPEMLQVRCYWKVTEEPGGDVSGNPEYYYDVFVDGKLTAGGDVSLHERADNELDAFNWNVTTGVRQGRVSALVDGEYAMLKLLQLMNAAQQTIHILNWKMDPQATLALEVEFQADYAQVPGLDEAVYRTLIAQSKPLSLGASAKDGLVAYTASNGNLVLAKADGSFVHPAVQQIDTPTNVDLPAAVVILEASSGLQMLVLDQLRSRLLLFLVVPRAGLIPVAENLFAALMAPSVAYPFFEISPTLPAIMADASLIAGVIPLAGT
jgi:hypothetical protein